MGSDKPLVEEWWNIHQVSDYLSVGPNSARKQLSRWKIRGVHLYPSGIVIAHHVARGHGCIGCGAPAPNGEFCDTCIQTAVTEIQQY
jgi:hypothetical protein